MTVYFDNAATTRVRDEAAEIMVKMMCEEYGNPSSTHAMGRAAKAALVSAREKVAGALGADVSEVFFTSGGTEADNWAIFGTAEAMWRKGKHIITSAIEHDAVNNPLKKLETQGWEVTYLTPDEYGRITAEAVAQVLRQDTVLVSVMMVNNETGAVNPIERISGVIKSSGAPALLHTDAVQGFCKIPFTAKKLGADMISVSGHKIHGPKGVGALYVRKGVKLPSFIYGGGQEGGKRSGTEGLPAIAAFAEAARLGRAEMAESTANMRAVSRRVISRLEENAVEFQLIGAQDAPHILSLSLPGYKSEVLMNYLDAEGICVSKSSACKRGKRSHVLEAMSLPNRVIDGAIRVSFSKFSTVDEAVFFADKLAEASKRLLKVL